MKVWFFLGLACRHLVVLSVSIRLSSVFLVQRHQCLFGLIRRRAAFVAVPLVAAVKLVALLASHFGLQHFPFLRCSLAFTLGPDVSLNKLSHARRLSSQDVILCREDVWNASHKLGTPLPPPCCLIAGAAVEQCSVVLQSCAGLIFLFVRVSCCGVTGNTWAFSQRLYGLHSSHLQSNDSLLKW